MPPPDGGRAQGGYWYAAAIRSSDLPPSARLVALAIVGQADNATGKLVRSLSGLAGDTGLDRRTVMRQLAALEAGGWLLRDSPRDHAALGARKMTTYTTVIPNGFPTRGTTPLALGAQSAESRGTVPHSPYRTKGSGASASAPARSPASTGEGAPSADHDQPLPAQYGGPCACASPAAAKDDPQECIRCGGAITA